MMSNRIPAFAATALLVAWGTSGHTQVQPLPADPYPLAAAGWGPEAGNGLHYSRWVEDWTAVRAAGAAPLLKAMPLGRGMTLTMSTETRLRYEGRGNARLVQGKDHQGMFRNILGADLRVTPALRLYAEIGSGYVSEHRRTASANFENSNSLQQLFAEARVTVRSMLAGAMIGRQEFADGPRQLLSLGDGSNLHRTWNGVRLYLHAERMRFGAFDLRATQLRRGSFDEKVDHAERLQGVNASLVVSRDADGKDIYVDPFWIHSEMPLTAEAGTIPGVDIRDSLGLRTWGARGPVKFDATLVYQESAQADAWGIFAVQSLALATGGWKPRLTLHVDAASGASTGREHDGFNPLYSSSSYLGEGRFLGLRNLLLVAPGVSVSPRASMNFSVEYGFARRLREADAAYAGGVRSLAGTSGVAGHRIGGLFRAAGTWSGKLGKDTQVALAMGYERLAAGEVLRHAGLWSGDHGFVSTTFRY